MIIKPALRNTAEVQLLENSILLKTLADEAFFLAYIVLSIVQCV